MSEDELPDGPYERALHLKNIVESQGTGGSIEESHYRMLRAEIVGEATLRRIAPEFPRTCRDSGSLWAYLKEVHEGSGAYAARRVMINSEFEPLLDHLERLSSPTHNALTDVVVRYNADGVTNAWHKPFERRVADPEGAITASRTLLEEECRHILVFPT